MEQQNKIYFLRPDQSFSLNEACRVLRVSFEDFGFGIFLVGSVFTRQDFRDVDVRCILKDDAFALLFKSGPENQQINEKRLSLFGAVFSEYLQKRTGLPVDFQFQAQTEANSEFPGTRSALGI